MSLIVQSPWAEEMPKTYPAGRTCSQDGCSTVLSKYNATRYCGAHVPEPNWRYHGYGFKPCPDCGEIIEAGKHYCRPCHDKRRSEHPQSRECRYCGRILPEDLHHFRYIGKLHVMVGTCLDCEAEMKRERARERYEAKQRRVTVVFPNYTTELELK